MRTHPFRRQFTIGISLGLMTIFGLLLFNRTNINQVLLDDRARREVSYLCNELRKGTVTREEVCSQPLEQVAKFAPRYSYLKEQDGKWFERHNWSLFPKLDCAAENIRFQFLGRELHCEDGAGILDYRVEAGR